MGWKCLVKAFAAIGLGAKTVMATSADELNAAENGNAPTLSLSGATFTSKWFEGTDRVQIIELTVTNTHSSNFLTKKDGLNVTVTSSSVDLVRAATLNRLAPGQSAMVQVGVKNKVGVNAGTTCSATVQGSWGIEYNSPHTASSTVSGECGFGNYTADSTSLSWHMAPDWYNDVKFGIFIHWGIYSAPAYGNVGSAEDYAEWYWKRQHEPNYRSQTYQYHLKTYGQNLNYDDFIANFTASKFDAKAWVDLFAAAGARYFVPVTKHHDGFAIFDVPASTSFRSSVNYGPKRDFLKELFTAAKTYQPSLRRGTYFSLPEWYHPGYSRYATTCCGGFPGGPPINPYTGAQIPYTGLVQINDFVKDLQLPQMQKLAYDYETEIMWCDIGGANNSTLFASAWLNWARDRGRQVTFNSRCGLTGDFDTPEYSTNAGTKARKWESNRGMDPFSFGYNYQTPDNKYLTGKDVVTSLVDIVSKNGNFLLDVGPSNDGTIPDIMQKGLRDAGTWIHAHAESIFKTRYWPATPGADPFRYTTTNDAFYIHINSQPGTSVRVPDKVPYLPGDTVTVLGGSMNGTVVPVTRNSDGTITLTLTSAIIAADKYVWTFKIAYISTA